MKFLCNKNLKQKMIIAMIIVILVSFIVPNRTQASTGGVLSDACKVFFRFICDTVLSFTENMLIGNDRKLESLIVQEGAVIVGEKAELWDGEVNGVIWEDALKAIFGNKDAKVIIDYPTFSISPEKIFSNKIAVLNVNFIQDVDKTLEGDVIKSDNTKEGLVQLRTIIATWYKSLRTLAIVGLLSVLVYLGIRIMISSTGENKAKYKERIKDWIVAFCLLFVLHYIMSFTLTITERINGLLDNQSANLKTIEEYGTINGGEKALILQVYGSITGATLFEVSDVKVGDPITEINGYVNFCRLYSQLYEDSIAWGYTILYMVLTAFTITFIIRYAKRLIYVAFLTLMAPLVALSYPIDKVKDGKAQAFNLWLKEYVFNVIIQPFHLLVYTVLVSSATVLAQTNFIYAMVCMGFLIPAEKLIRKFFNLDQATTMSAAGSFAGGAIFSSIVGKLAKPPRPQPNGNGQHNGDSNKIRTQGHQLGTESLFGEKSKPEQEKPPRTAIGGENGHGGGLPQPNPSPNPQLNPQPGEENDNDDMTYGGEPDTTVPPNFGEDGTNNPPLDMNEISYGGDADSTVPPNFGEFDTNNFVEDGNEMTYGLENNTAVAENYGGYTAQDNNGERTYGPTKLTPNWGNGLKALYDKKVTSNINKLKDPEKRHDLEKRAIKGVAKGAVKMGARVAGAGAVAMVSAPAAIAAGIVTGDANTTMKLMTAAGTGGFAAGGSYGQAAINQVSKDYEYAKKAAYGTQWKEYQQKKARSAWTDNENNVSTLYTRMSKNEADKLLGLDKESRASGHRRIDDYLKQGITDANIIASAENMKVDAKGKDISSDDKLRYAKLEQAFGPNVHISGSKAEKEFKDQWKAKGFDKNRINDILNTLNTNFT